EDVYVDGQVIPVSIAGTSGGNFEAVNTTTYGNATVTFKDTIDDTTVSLTATPSITEADTSITYTATLSHPAQAGQPVTVTLSTGDV
ncbi:immunoglobulin-like domain-containing protein, partial [Bradyrhizobium diazoefficiens]